MIGVVPVLAICFPVEGLGRENLMSRGILDGSRRDTVQTIVSIAQNGIVGKSLGENSYTRSTAETMFFDKRSSVRLNDFN